MQAVAAVPAAIIMVLSGCLGGLTPAEDGPWLATGQVFDAEGRPIAGMLVASDIAHDETDLTGRFRVMASGDWAWLTVDDQVRPAFPGHDAVFRITPHDHRLLFGGDVMFAREFYTPGWPGPNLAGTDAAQILEDAMAPLAPYLSSADATVVNLESVLGRQLERHPQKAYTFLSPDEAAGALANAGVDVVTLGNNHIIDALAPGVQRTIDVAGAAGLTAVGAGQNTSLAWRPIEVLPDVWLWSCVHQSTHPFFDHPARDDKPGAAYCGDLAQHADTREGTHILSAHSDAEFQIAAAPWTRALAEQAATLGFDAFLAHGSHVGGGLDLVDGMPVAWGLGNLVFDSIIWPTEFTVIAGMEIGQGNVTRLWLEPMARDPLVAAPMRPDAGLHWLRRLAAESGPVLVDGVLELDLRGVAPASADVPETPGVHRIQDGLVHGFERGIDIAPVAPPMEFLMGMRVEGDAWVLDGVGGPSNPLRPTGPTTIIVEGTGDISIAWRADAEAGNERGQLPLIVEAPAAERLSIDLHGQARITAFDVVDWGLDSPWTTHVRVPKAPDVQG